MLTIGSLTCRSRKMKCDGARPQCKNCHKSRVKCNPSSLISFRHWQHPATPQSLAKKGRLPANRARSDRDPPVRFVDETDTVAAKCQDILNGWPIDGSNDNNCPGDSTRHDVPASQDSDSGTTTSRPYAPPSQHTPTEVDCDSQGMSARESSTEFYHDAPLSPCDVSFGTNSESNAGNRLGIPSLCSTIPDTSIPAMTANTSPYGLTPNSVAQAPMETNDHTSHLIPNHLPVISEYLPSAYQPADEDLNSPASSRSSFFTSDESGRGAMVSMTEANLLRKFSSIVGTWIDLADASQTFSKKVCHLAMQDPLLKAASIACAAKQQFLVGKLQDGMQIARQNYNKAISLLIPRLGKSEQPLATYGFAATVIFTVYEMLDAPKSDWQRHLDGVFSFGKVHRVNGASGGIEQAGFWCIARQEVVCAIIHGSKLRLDPDLWAVDLVNIGKEGDENLIHNQVLTILAKTVDFMACFEATSNSRNVEEWHKLRHLLDHWRSSVQQQGFMEPAWTFKGDSSVFPSIWFTVNVCASSWQMFHLAQILLLTNNPSQGRSCMLAFRKVEEQLLYHARQICGIAQSKPHGSCRLNSVQPIYYAGLCFSDKREREATIVLLEEIEDDLGWAAKFRVQDLRRIYNESGT